MLGRLLPSPSLLSPGNLRLIWPLQLLIESLLSPYLAPSTSCTNLISPDSSEENASQCSSIFKCIPRESETGDEFVDYLLIISGHGGAERGGGGADPPDPGAG